MIRILFCLVLIAFVFAETKDEYQKRTEAQRVVNSDMARN